MTTYRTIHTNYGLTRMAQAETSGVPINLVAMAVGDGNGNPVTPSETQTQLIREITGTRTAPNRVYQDPTNPLLFTVEMIVPASIGGFTIREVGVWDDQAGLFAVANVPDTYKPQGDGSEGSFSDTVIRMQFLVTNASVVTLEIDPNVAVATQTWVTNAITLPFLLKGGFTGQILSKKTNADGDTEWVDPTVANVTVDTVEEDQTIAVGQTAVTLATATTRGLSVYIEGTRLKSTDWTADPTDVTKLTLAANTFTQAVSAIFVQNEPAGFAPDPLLQSKNLSDVKDVPTARANLSVYSKAETDQKAPPSLVAYFATSAAPTGWLKANGAAISRTVYAALFSAIGVVYGAGDGFNTFNLPDMRGVFPRGFDDGRGVDAGRAMGSFQASGLGSHTHTANTDTVGDHAHNGTTAGAGTHDHGLNTRTPLYINDIDRAINGGASAFSIDDAQDPRTTFVGDHAHVFTTAGAGTHAHTVFVNAAGIAETRPSNMALLACIKY